MKAALIVSVLLVTVCAQEKYKSDLEGDFDLKELLNNERLLLSYTRCLIDKGPCTPEVKAVKDKLPEALATKCAKCTDKQKELGKKLAVELKRTHPSVWQQLVAKYDPRGEHQAAFQEFLTKQ